MGGDDASSTKELGFNSDDLLIGQQQDLFESSGAGGGAGSAKDYIHIRIQQRNGRKSLTTVQGLRQDYDIKKICKAFKKEFSCNGTVVGDETAGIVIQLQGDQRKNVASFLAEQGISHKDAIRVHGA